MDGRRISTAAVAAVLAHGRAVWARGAQIYALGKREVQRAARRGLDLRPYAGLQVVCAPDGDILTVYRNHDFRSLRRTA
jgi:hypothetical protein